MDQALNDTGWRGSQEGWLEAAYHSLLDSGVDSVKILPLAKKLNLSRTSFYWFFKDREELLAGLVARWRDKTPATSSSSPKPTRNRLPRRCSTSSIAGSTMICSTPGSNSLYAVGRCSPTRFSPRSGKPISSALMRSSGCLCGSGYQKRHQMSEREQLTSCRSDTSLCKPRRNSPSA